MDHRIHQVPAHQALQLPTAKTSKNDNHESSFKDVLAEQQQLKISKHATERLEERNIHINDKQWQAIGEKMEEAKQKGITDSLVVTNKAALLVSAKNNTVVTAMNREEATNRIFTNINGTILIDE
ncbi:flagellar operon protein [Virgibacillus halotolerans]|uniref:TIGR02530 family flagellar biosynthesis protein n=1 Tax=Virgibacillus halotolerans TaxID=1071053 RepID=UPI0019612F08|nr:TIGR02530 family flagellar biosynthesis protein [Virgibacillus halotolerans]MBM7598590.1 flagellar operon protein [Virgibacillus halotolerans]